MPRKIIVTGGGSGIGLAAVRRFVAAGDRVAIIDWNGRAAEAVADSLDGVIAIKCDVADEQQVAAAVADVAAAFGRIDVLVNNAGIVGDQLSTLDMPIDAVRSILSVNLTGAYIVACEAARAMAATGGGAIVNTASLGGLVAVPNRTVYSASKAALIDLTQSLARDWAGRGVRVNAVLPGFVMTEILAKLLRERGADLAAMERAIPLGRLADPDEIAGAIEHLAGIAATGVALAVDGGFAAFGGVGDASSGGMARPDGRSTGRNVLLVGDPVATEPAARRFAAAGDRVVAVGGGESIDDALARIGTVDVLINRIGGDVASGGGEVSPVEFGRIIDRDLTGALQVAPRGRARHDRAGGGSDYHRPAQIRQPGAGRGDGRAGHGDQVARLRMGGTRNPRQRGADR